MVSDPVTALPAASVIVLRPAFVGFEVLLVRRPERGAFGGLIVFPGGKVEPVDGSRVGRAVVSSGREDQSSRSAALRELAEETGLLMTDRGLRRTPQLRGEHLWQSLMARGETVPGDDLVLVSRWLTPETASKRFDTRFYLLAVPESAEVRLDEEELAGHAWVTPADALSRHDRGEWPMILPTISHLRWLGGRPSIDQAFESAFGADGRTVIAPRVMPDGSLVQIYVPAGEM